MVAPGSTDIQFRGTSSGFTLVELMIVVAIVGILASIAIPNFHAMTYRAKRAEVPVHVGAIGRAEFAYQAEWDVFTACPLTPPTSPESVAVPFGVGPTDDHPFPVLGWVPDGLIRSQYMVSATEITYLVTGQSDLDHNGELSIYTATQDAPVQMITPNGVY
jgi:prepilin-type N-terminal cleavage/methylation domain-containing protein